MDIVIQQFDFRTDKYWIIFSKLQWNIQDFPEEGGGCQCQRGVRQPIILAIFSCKLHEIEKNWTKEGRMSLT